MTPLHLVVEREHSRIVEVLVGYGADVNMACSDGHTPLHVVTTNKDLKKPTPQTQQLQRVRIRACYIWFMEYSIGNSACNDAYRHISWEKWHASVWLIERTYSCCETAKSSILPVWWLPDFNNWFHLIPSSLHLLSVWTLFLHVKCEWSVCETRMKCVLYI